MNVYRNGCQTTVEDGAFMNIYIPQTKMNVITNTCPKLDGDYKMRSLVLWVNPHEYEIAWINVVLNGTDYQALRHNRNEYDIACPHE